MVLASFTFPGESAADCNIPHKPRTFCPRCELVKVGEGVLKMSRSECGPRRVGTIPLRWVAEVEISETQRSGDCGSLRIRRAFRKQGIQPFVVSINIIEKVHSTVFLRDRGHVENQDWDLHRQVNLPIVFA